MSWINVLTRGIYSISNGYVPLVMDLAYGDSRNGASINGWQKHPFGEIGCTGQLWYLKPYDGEANTFTIQNLRGGTYVDLSNGRSENGTAILGFQRTGDNQVWVIRQIPGSNYYKIQNRHAGTFVDLKDGTNWNGTLIVGNKGNWTDINSSHSQLWSFQRTSRTGRELNTFVNVHQNLHYPFGLPPNKLYWIMDQGLLKSIWDSANIGYGRQYSNRKEILDCDDLAQLFKAQVVKWGNDNIKAEEFGVLCGVALRAAVVSEENGNAYNFTLSSDGYSIEFFDPQTGHIASYVGGDYVAFF